MNKQIEYKVIFNKDIAVMLQILTGQKPYIFNHNQGRGEVYSFIRNEEFDKTLDFVLSRYSKVKK